MDIEIIQTVERVRRMMPRNGDVMRLCAWIEQTLAKPTTRVQVADVSKPSLTRAQIQKNYRERKKARKAEQQ